MSITYSAMYCKRLINPPRHVIDKYIIGKKLSIWRHQDNIWRTLGAARGGSTRFQRWKLYFVDNLGIMYKYWIEHVFKHNAIHCSIIYFPKQGHGWVRIALFCSLTIKDLSKKSKFHKSIYSTYRDKHKS